MDSAIVSALVAVLGTGVLSLVGAILLGKLVPSGHLNALREEANRWKQAYEEKSRSLAILEETVRRQQMVTDTTNAVLNAIKQSTVIGQQIQGGGP